MEDRVTVKMVVLSAWLNILFVLHRIVFAVHDVLRGHIVRTYVALYGIDDLRQADKEATIKAIRELRNQLLK